MNSFISNLAHELGIAHNGPWTPDVLNNNEAVASICKLNGCTSQVAQQLLHALKAYTADPSCNGMFFGAVALNSGAKNVGADLNLGTACFIDLQTPANNAWSFADISDDLSAIYCNGFVVGLIGNAPAGVTLESYTRSILPTIPHQLYGFTGFIFLLAKGTNGKIDITMGLVDSSGSDLEWFEFDTVQTEYLVAKALFLNNGAFSSLYYRAAMYGNIPINGVLYDTNDKIAEVLIQLIDADASGVVDVTPVAVAPVAVAPVAVAPVAVAPVDVTPVDVTPVTPVTPNYVAVDTEFDPLTNTEFDPLPDPMTNTEFDPMPVPMTDTEFDPLPVDASDNVYDDLSDNVYDNVSDKVCDKVCDKVYDNVSDDVSDTGSDAVTVHDNMYDKVYDKVYDNMYDKVYDNVSDTVSAVVAEPMEVGLTSVSLGRGDLVSVLRRVLCASDSLITLILGSSSTESITSVTPVSLDAVSAVLDAEFYTEDAIQSFALLASQYAKDGVLSTGDALSCVAKAVWGEIPDYSVGRTTNHVANLMYRHKDELWLGMYSTDAVIERLVELGYKPDVCSRVAALTLDIKTQIPKQRRQLIGD